MNDCKKNFGFTKKSGILMPLSALPSPYGVGSMGKEAFDFIDFLSDTAQKCWQVLPLNPTSYGDSPYQSPASAAGNPYFIDLPTLKAEGLLTAEELRGARRKGKRIDYGDLFNERYNLLRRAFSRFVPDGDFRKFCSKNKSWLDDYALFMSLKVHYSYRPWNEWDVEHKDVKEARKQSGKFAEECAFWKFLQYKFFEQWQTVLNYAHTKGILVIGDMPIYVAHDSVDVWRAPEQFLLDEDLLPKEVAGCPPDPYAEDGQLWGNPIYNWEKMKADGFGWWCDRVKASTALYDIVRIDHFRGFASYYSIPYGDENARGGRWVTAPGKELFDAIKAKNPKAKIIAEDLGFITDDVRELLAYTDFPGMKLLQFAFYSPDSEYLPRKYTTDNTVVYTASHDSDCSHSWAQALSGEDLLRFKKECPREKGESSAMALIRLAMRSRGNLVVIPMQDYLELTNAEGRINVPAQPSGNWQWRLCSRYDTPALREKITNITVSSGRKNLRKQKLL